MPKRFFFLFPFLSLLFAPPTYADTSLESVILDLESARQIVSELSNYLSEREKIQNERESELSGKEASLTERESDLSEKEALTEANETALSDLTESLNAQLKRSERWKKTALIAISAAVLLAANFLR